MKVILQRTSKASVEVKHKIVGSIEKGLVVLSGIGLEDDEKNLSSMAEKIVDLRIFPNEKGRFHYSLKDISGGILIIPQFTLFADTSKGRRPEFFGAMKPPRAEELFLLFAERFIHLGISPVEKGIFGATMQVALVNDGPVTISLEN